MPFDQAPFDKLRASRAGAGSPLPFDLFRVFDEDGGTN
jgi:hypothetical protein